ncbi:UDP-glucose 6-dehydrogenase 3 [Olea europaea subsp. europaea]|uniref:UDP-glucose 6-dehydrogenase 3 n=1 Tax=Olea europaea subsp. europaea TaxID=158383 RepID=A0A8S0P6B7_OLEEU|nr:UDP-glucose 6-dehydrogenase 3 [Olea europaea subsp. europaea]
MAVTALKVPSIEMAGVDISVPRINAWNSNQLPSYETGLNNIAKQCREKNTFSSTDVKKRVSEVDIVFVSVNTPIKTRGIGAGKAADLFGNSLSSKSITSPESTWRILCREPRTRSIIIIIIYYCCENQSNQNNTSENRDKFCSFLP